MNDDQKKQLRDLVRHLEDDIRERHYTPAHDAAQNICSGVYEMIPVDVHDLVHEAAMAGYAAALIDMEKGNLDDQVRERSELLD